MTEGWGRMDSPFDDIFARFFGSGLSSQPPVQRVDLGRLLNDGARRLIATARDAATEWGNSEITPEHLLYAAAQNDPTRGVLTSINLDPDEVASKMAAHLDKHGTPKTTPGSPSLSPAAKLALRTAQQQAS